MCRRLFISFNTCHTINALHRTFLSTRKLGIYHADTSFEHWDEENYGVISQLTLIKNSTYAKLVVMLTVFSFFLMITASQDKSIPPKIFYFLFIYDEEPHQGRALQTHAWVVNTGYTTPTIKPCISRRSFYRRLWRSGFLAS